MKLISRRKVLEYMADYHWNNRGVAMDWTEAIDDIFNEVEKMPIIESRPKGKWEEATMNFANNKYINAIFGQGYYCSNCGMYMPNTKTNFCANCGADMRGEKNERI